MSERVGEYRRKLEEHERREGEELRRIRLDDLLSTGLREAIIPELGAIQYGLLTVEDWLKLSRIEDRSELTVAVVAMMLSKADPSVTVEKVKALPLAVFNALAETLSKDIVNFRIET
jgi:hypothetical protein